ncbi:ScbA/BarX family gamma-butyrolactone biosynthesis protein [Kitasatospora sp. NPDC093558]|uniref:ScbA/BarX family gamma-butyrolactone biosynthesis protein n=1 Tax=Kitasatospora sp. NPDC093558 TaxID=3155201 RepID=UPI003441401D
MTSKRGKSVTTTAHQPLPCTLSTAVPREYVHKATMAEVLLTGWQVDRREPDTFTATAQWPRSHSYYYAAGERLHDPLLFAETVRQLLPLLSHAAYDVPFGHQLIWDRFSFELNAAALHIECRPAELHLHISCHDITHRRGVLSGMAMEVVASRDGVHLGTALSRFTCHSPTVYARLRGRPDGSPTAIPVPPPLAPHHAMRDRLSDVVLSHAVTANRWQLRVDTDHPVLFDHPVDHAPGMLLIEAARQAGHAASYPSHGVLVGLDNAFGQYAELDAPCWIQAAPLPGQQPNETRLTITACQHDREIYSAVATYAHAPAL